jgi:hypothetical protein
VKRALLVLIAFGSYAALFAAAGHCIIGGKNIVCTYKDPHGRTGLDFLVPRAKP